MSKYHKIQTVYKRDPETNNKTLLMGQYSLPEFEYLRNNKWIWTEKIDGTNIRVDYAPFVDWVSSIDLALQIKGKTDNAQTPGFLVDAIRELVFPKAKIFKELFLENDVTLYGEGYGARIQKGGGNYRKDNGFVLFDIRIGDWWLKREDVEEIGKKLDLEVAPIVGEGTLDEMVEFVRNGFNSRWGDFIAEGVVARPAVELQARNGDRIITKLKYKDFVR